GDRAAIAKDLDRWLTNLDRFGIARAGVPLPLDTPHEVFDRLARHKNRIFVTLASDPHRGVPGLRRIQELCSLYPQIRAISHSADALLRRQRAVAQALPEGGPRLHQW